MILLSRITDGIKPYKQSRPSDCKPSCWDLICLHPLTIGPPAHRSGFHRSVQCRVLKGAGSQSVVNILWWVSVSKAFYRVVAKLGEAAQLCVFILGMQYFYLGVLKGVFRYGCAVFVLVTSNPKLQHYIPLIKPRISSFLSSSTTTDLSFLTVALART